MKYVKSLLFFMMASIVFLSCQLEGLSKEGSISVVLPKAPEAKIARAGDLAEQSLFYSISVLANGEEVQTNSGESLQTVTFTVLAGDYEVKVKAYDVEDKEFEKPLYSGITPVTVLSGQTTEAKVVLKQIEYEPEENYIFYKNVWDEAAGLNGYNYYLPIGISPDNVFFKKNYDTIKSLKKGTKITVTTTFVPDSDFEGVLSFYYANSDLGEKQSWKLLNEVLQKVSWKKDTECTYDFDFVLQSDVIADNVQEYALVYFPDELDKSINVVMKNISVNPNADYETVTYKYHYGNQTYSIITKAGIEYIPIDGPNLTNYFNPCYTWLNKVNGWVEKGDESKTVVNSIPAEENNKNREFYLDYELLFMKNEWGLDENGNKTSSYGYHYRTEAPFSVYFPEITTLPEPGSHFKLFFTVTNKELAGKELSMKSCLSDTINGWDEFANATYTGMVDENGKYEAYFDLVLPKNKNPSNLNNFILHFDYGSNYLDKEAVFTNWSIKIVDRNPFVSEKATTKHMILSTCENGVHVVINALESETFGLSIRRFIDKETGTYFSFDDEELNETRQIEFDYPLCVQNQEMCFEFEYLLIIDGVEEKNSHKEVAYVLAGGGNGPLDYSDFDKMVLSYDTETYKLNLSNPTYKTLKTTTNKILELKEINAGFELLYGYPDWHEDTGWLTGQNIPLSELPSEMPMSALFRGEGINILADGCWWSNKEDVDEELSKHKTLFITMHYEFKFKENELEPGYFCTTNIETDATPYKANGLTPAN